MKMKTKGHKYCCKDYKQPNQNISKLLLNNIFDYNSTYLNVK